MKLKQKDKDTLAKAFINEIINMGYSTIESIRVIDMYFSYGYNCFTMEFEIVCSENDGKPTQDLIRLSTMEVYVRLLNYRDLAKLVLNEQYKGLTNSKKGNYQLTLGMLYDTIREISKRKGFGEIHRV